MRRWLTLVVVAMLAGAVAVPATAVGQAAPPDPVRAVQKQLRHGHGVRLSELHVSSYGKEPLGRTRSQVQLSPSGPVAYDSFTHYLVLSELMPDAPETAMHNSLAEMDWDDITHVGEVTYLHALPGYLPDGKAWIRVKPDRFYDGAFSGQPIDVLDTRMLRTVLRGITGKAVSGGYAYQGVVTRGLLGTAKGRWAKDKISWRLWTDAKGLPTRLRTTITMHGNLDSGMTQDTRFRDWGFPLVVTAPPADQVIDERDLPE
ncbi:hypothetical protein [Herbidospora mongoliensis]|uniref:hypothetical protein n=1 Tax=Herbidospora mongoliensis TaxID=688067 RepID=UPI000A93B66A|nr:hypothetical protein [Herbidospora mongoliensis]